MTISSQIPNNSKNDLEAPKRPILDLRAWNLYLGDESDHLNGKKLDLDRFPTRFQVIKIPKDLRGLVLRELIYQKYSSLEKFGKKIGRPKSWVYYLIYKPEKVKVKQETNQKINQALGIEIIF